jgi:hypothetical protein
MCHLIRASALCAAAPVLAGTVFVPPSGETTYVTHYMGRVINTEYLGDGASESLVEMTGMSRNVGIRQDARPLPDALGHHRRQA